LIIKEQAMAYYNNLTSKIEVTYLPKMFYLRRTKIKEHPKVRIKLPTIFTFILP